MATSYATSWEEEQSKSKKPSDFTSRSEPTWPPSVPILQIGKWRPRGGKGLGQDYPAGEPLKPSQPLLWSHPISLASGSSSVTCVSGIKVDHILPLYKTFPGLPIALKIKTWVLDVTDTSCVVRPRRLPPTLHPASACASPPPSLPPAALPAGCVPTTHSPSRHRAFAQPSAWWLGTGCWRFKSHLCCSPAG